MARMISVLFALAAFIGATSAFAAEAPHTAHGVHGMVLLAGAKELYVSHLPLYRAPHDWQVLAQVSMDPADRQRLAASLGSDTQQLLTIEPERFDLMRLAPGHSEPLKAFRADVYLGHFERGGKKILEGVRFNVDRVLVHRPLRADLPRSERLRYFVFGDAHAQYLAHIIGGAPDFDQLIAVSDAVQLCGQEVEVDVLNAPDKARQVVDSGGLHVRAHQGASVALHAPRSVYFETDDLER